VFGIFFNQNENEILAHKEVRQALSLSLDKDQIIKRALGGYGAIADGPLPSSTDGGLADLLGTSTGSFGTSSPENAGAKILTKTGWKKDTTTNLYTMTKGKGKTMSTSTISLSIATANVPELANAAKDIEKSWNDFGVKTNIRVFEPSDLTQSVIRTRKYDALLFGLVTGRNPDLYPFWHSSQRNDPGLNIAMYTNIKADKLLEKMRQATSSDIFADEYADLRKIINSETPAIFLWSPDYIYAVPDKIHGVRLGEITTSGDRFLDVRNWYIETDHVWRYFIQDASSILDTN
jgi:peptide/nickel transport system substrate-binding protein